MGRLIRDKILISLPATRLSTEINSRMLFTDRKRYIPVL